MLHYDYNDYMTRIWFRNSHKMLMHHCMRNKCVQVKQDNSGVESGLEGCSKTICVASYFALVSGLLKGQIYLILNVNLSAESRCQDWSLYNVSLRKAQTVYVCSCYQWLLCVYRSFSGC